MHLGGDEQGEAAGLRPGDRIGGQERRLRKGVFQIGEDGARLGDHLALGQFQRRHQALGVDPTIRALRKGGDRHIVIGQALQPERDPHPLAGGITLEGVEFHSEPPGGKRSVHSAARRGSSSTRRTGPASFGATSPNRRRPGVQRDTTAT